MDISAPFVFIVRLKLKPGHALIGCCKIVTHETQEYLTEIHRAELQTTYFFKSHSCFLFGEVHCVGEDKTPSPTPWSTQWSTINGLPRRIFDQNECFINMVRHLHVHSVIYLELYDII